MDRRRIWPALLTLATLVVVLLVSKYGPEQMEAGDGPSSSAPDAPVVMPANLAGLLITFGVKDQDATVWEGEISPSAGKIVATDISDGNAKKSSVKAGKFSVKSAVVKKDEKKKKEIVTPAALRVTLDAPAATRVKVATNQGNFDFVLSDLPDSGAAQGFLKGNVTVAREDGAMRLTTGEEEHDYPTLAKQDDGTLWLAYSDYTKGTPYVTERVMRGDFDSLVPQGNGDQIRLKSYNGTTWSAAVNVTEKGLDIWRPSVAVARGRVHVSWSQQVNGNWDIYHRVYTPPAKAGEQGKWSPIIRLTSDPGADYNVVSTTSSAGQVWLAWQALRQGRFQILARKLTFRDDETSVDLAKPEIQVTKTPANHWNPAIAADAAGKVYVGYDTYEKDNYDVHVAEVAGSDVRTFVIAGSARFEARNSLVCDKQNRLWIAYEEGDEQWGKDYANTPDFRKIGLASNPGNPLYLKRTVRVKCLVDGQVMQPSADLQAALLEKTANNKSVPRLAVDQAGGLWLLYRHHPRPFGLGEVWNSFAIRYDGQKWSTPRRLGYSANLMDNRPALMGIPGGLMTVFSGDGRNNQLTRKQDHLYAAILPASALARAAELIPSPPDGPAKVATVHPNEARDVERFRAYRFEHEGKKLRMIRGEFHRHTEYTAHRDGDGLLEDAWRYALDPGNLDWMGDGDHDNGHHDEYSWWQIQKTTDIMHHPPQFLAVHSYERSVKYPDGHRNIIFPKRGIRPMPRGSFEGSEEKGTPDTFVLYKYLKHFGSMCSSHTSATGMGTDWRNNDPVVEPVVEIYQGHRHNYEFIGAPRSATKETNIGGYEPKGFVIHALDKGYKLGFQASSDHISTHMSYGIVLTDDVSRQGIIDAFKRRHSYAATDNIIAEFRCGKHIMGDIFDIGQAPKLDIKVLGTAPIAKISIIRDGKYVHVVEPKKQQAEVTFTDAEAPLGTTCYYYVRVEQSDANLAWLSPMWITYKK
jgi:hypothetical protein